MFVKNIADCPAFTANDGCTIQEWVHPENDGVDLPYSVAIAVVAAGQSSYKHRLKQAEMYLVMDGAGVMHIDAEERIVGTGDSILIPADSTQWIENTGSKDLRFIAIVSPPWREEDDTRLA